MNNFIEYFYNIKVDKIIKNDKYYSFSYNSYHYKLYIYDYSYNINLVLDIDRRLLNNTLISEIIFNVDGKPISVYDNVSYILIKIYVDNNNKIVTLDEINYLANSLTANNLNINWGMLWSKKIDYLEKIINENGKKYPLVVDSFNYYVGWAENAITYYNNINISKYYMYVISHKCIRINDTMEELYNPLNIIFDYRVRDIAEYIKNAFFQGNNNIYQEISDYLKYQPLSFIDVKLLVSRLLYPSFYFELYEDILTDRINERIIITYISKTNEYEKYIASIIDYFKKYYDIDEINWLKK